jgi:hypothetical protein
MAFLPQKYLTNFSPDQPIGNQLHMTVTSKDTEGRPNTSSANEVKISSR